jgi:hypothetical protein
VQTHNTYCTIGWVDFGLFYIFNKSTPEICYIPSKSNENSQKNVFDPKTIFSFIFVTFERFERYVTNVRGTFVPVPISTHPTAHSQPQINLLISHRQYMYPRVTIFSALCKTKAKQNDAALHQFYNTDF